jgi:hypothetical protein
VFDAAMSVFVFGIFLLLTAFGFLLIPNTLLVSLKNTKNRRALDNNPGNVCFANGFSNCFLESLMHCCYINFNLIRI